MGVCVIAGFRREADENLALMGYYEVSGGNLLPTFRDIIGPILRGSRIQT